MRGLDRRSRLLAVAAIHLTLFVAGGAYAADPKLRVVLIVPFDASGLDREEQWTAEGIAQILGLGLAQQPTFVQVERAVVQANSCCPWPFTPTNFGPQKVPSG